MVRILQTCYGRGKLHGSPWRSTTYAFVRWAVDRYIEGHFPLLHCDSIGGRLEADPELWHLVLLHEHLGKSGVKIA